MHTEHKNTALFAGGHGGTVNQFQVDGNNMLFFPQYVKIGKDLKLRGGIPFMFPNFGPVPEDCEYKLPQHGLARHKQFQLLYSGGPWITAYDTVFKPDTGSKFPFKYETEIHNLIDGAAKSLRQTINVSNLGSSKKMPIGFGQHPYFQTPHGGEIVLGADKFFTTEDLSGTKTVMVSDVGTTITIHLNKIGTVTMKLKDAFATDQATIYIWSDSPEYVCVEPVICDSKLFNTPNGIYLSKSNISINAECEYIFEPF